MEFMGVGQYVWDLKIKVSLSVTNDIKMQKM